VKKTASIHQFLLILLLGMTPKLAMATEEPSRQDYANACADKTKADIKQRSSPPTIDYHHKMKVGSHTPNVDTPRNQLVYFGGGIPSHSKDVEFEYGYDKVKRYSEVNQQTWDSEFFNSWLHAHPDPKDNSFINDFNDNSFRSKINELVQQINESKIRPGDQLLIYIDTHGTGFYNEFSYRFVASDYVDPRPLRKLQQVAETKGVKLAIVGLPCGSGNLLDYGSDKTCVISSSQKHKVGIMKDGESVAKALNDPNIKNLEEAYLKARLDTLTRNDDNEPVTFAAQPMISTRAGKETDELLSPFRDLIFQNKADLKFRLGLSVAHGYRQIFEILQIKMPNLPKLLNKDLYNELRLEIEEYESLMQKAIKRNNQIHKVEQTEICVFKEAKKICATSQYWDYVEGYHEPCVTANALLTDPCTCYAFSEYFSMFSSVVQTPEYRNYKSILQNDEIGADANLYKNIFSLSEKIAAKERILYDQLYRQAARQNRAPNPCEKFKLR